VAEIDFTAAELLSLRQALGLRPGQPLVAAGLLAMAEGAEAARQAGPAGQACDGPPLTAWELETIRRACGLRPGERATFSGLAVVLAAAAVVAEAERQAEGPS
jgi:hypothetical protein